MSLFNPQTRLLSLRPSIVETEESITVRTGFMQKLFTLGMSLREVEILPANEEMWVRTRSAWFATDERVYRYDELWFLEYEFAATSTSWNMVGDAHDQVENFTIAVVTVDEQRIPICNFRGEGSVSSGWGGVLLGDSFTDWSGTQEGESRGFARYLAALLSLPFGRPYADEVPMHTCPACGQVVSPNTRKCLYCGEQI